MSEQTKQTILAVLAHPDDESTFLGGTIPKYVKQGVIVDLICATRGEKGNRLDVLGDIDLGDAREAELRAAAAIIKIRNIYFLGYIDGTMEKSNADEITNKVLEIMQQIRPEIVITFGPDGYTGHKDHVTIGEATTRAFNKVLATSIQPRKLFYVTIPESVVPNADEYGIYTRPDEEVTRTIDISSYLEVKIQAIATHRSQEDSRQFAEMLKQGKESLFANNEFFYLANDKDMVKGTDLFQ